MALGDHRVVLRALGWAGGTQRVAGCHKVREIASGGERVGLEALGQAGVNKYIRAP